MDGRILKWYGRGHETHGSHRPHVRTFNGFGISAQTRPARFLAFCLYLREHERNCDGLRKKRRREVVRMHPPREVPIRLEPNSARRRSSRASDAATFDLARDVKTMFPDQQRAIHCAIRPTGDYRLHRMGRLPDVQSVGAAPKIGPIKSPRVFGTATALPPGYIEGYARKNPGDWESGICRFTVWGGRVHSFTFEGMHVLQRKYGAT